MRNIILAAVLSGTVAISAVGTANAVDDTVTVSGDTSAGENQPGWLFNRDPGNTTDFEFNFDVPAIGSGSLFVEPIGASAPDKFIGELFLGVDSADLTSASIDYQLADGVAAAKSSHFYWNVYANFGDSNPDKFYDCRYNYVASGGSDATFTSLEFGPDVIPTSVSTRASSPHACPATLGGMDDVEQVGSPVIRMAAINVGDTSANDFGVGGYLDKVVVTVGADTTTYDFEPAPQTKQDCKKGGFASYGFKNQGQCVASIVANPDAHK
jgi:hypothetical protein